VKSAEWVNILEHALDGKESTVGWDRDTGRISVELDFRAFEIKTLKLTLV